MIFLIEYDRARGKLIKMRSFDDADRHLAEQCRLEMEVALIKSSGTREVLILESESETLLRRTHSRYFETLKEMTKVKDDGKPSSGDR